QNALVEMLQQTFLAPGIMHPVARQPFLARALKLVRMFYKGFGAHIVFGILAVAGAGTWFAVHLLPPASWRTVLRRALYYLFQNRRTAPFWLVTAGFLFYSFLD